MDRRDFLFFSGGAAALIPLSRQSSSAQAKSAEPVLSHPRLYFDTKRIIEIRSRIQKDLSFAARWHAFVDRADGLLKANLVSETAAEKGQGDDADFGAPSYQIAEIGVTLAVAYHVTEDQRYADKLRTALLHYASYSKWHGPGFPKRVPPWHSELNTARFCFGMATGYDALGSALSTAERKTVREALIRLGILPILQDWVLPESRVHCLDSMGHNWWAVCISNAGVAALALLGEEPRADEWVEKVCGALDPWFKYQGNVLQNKSRNFDSAGAFYESINYANYALFEYLRFRLAYSNVFPGRKLPDYDCLTKACDYFFHTFYPSSNEPLTVNFGDSGLHLQVAPTIRLLVESGFSHPAAGWYLAKTKSAPEAMEMVARNPVPQPAHPVMPNAIIYSDIGWAILRNSWKDDATLLAVKSGFTWNHAHADAGSFVLFHNGVPLIIDSGSCSYAMKEYSDYYVQSRAHNVVLFQGKGEREEDHLRGVKFPGALHDLVDDLGVKYVYADATGPMANVFSRNYRHWLWIEDVILIFDDVLSHNEGTCEWLLHYEGKTEQGPTGISPTGILLTNGQTLAEIHPLYPRTLDLREETGLADHAPDRRVPYLSFREREPNRVHKFITAIVPNGVRNDAQRPKLHPTMVSDTTLGLRIERNGLLTDVVLNLEADGRRMHLNSNNNVSGWETDAYLLSWTRPATREDDASAVTRFFVSCASYLRRSGQVYFQSFAKKSVVWAPQSMKRQCLEGPARPC